MKCPKCKFEQDVNPVECPRCGIIFSKYKNPSAGIEEKSQTDGFQYEEDTGADHLLFGVRENLNPLVFAGQCLLLAFLIFLSIRYMSFSVESNRIANSFFHLVNLPFHEAGHIFFRPFGRLITSMGGSLGQVLMPLICMAVLLLKTHDPFGASVTFWWFGENFLDMAPYINDARSLSIPLLGGNFGYSSPYGFHDWEFILGELKLTHLDHTFAKAAFLIGCTIMVLSVVWAGIVLFRQRRHLM